MTERVRVLRIIDRLNVGGPALQASVLMEGLDRSRFDQRLLTGTVAPGEGDFVGIRAPDLAMTVVPGLGRAPRVLLVQVNHLVAVQPVEAERHQDGEVGRQHEKVEPGRLVEMPEGVLLGEKAHVADERVLRGQEHKPTHHHQLKPHTCYE